MRPLRSRVFSAAGWAYGVLFLAFLLFPAFIILPISLSQTEMLEFPPRNIGFGWFVKVLGDRGWLGSARVSLTLAASSAALSTAAGLLVAVAHYRVRRLGTWQLFLLSLPLFVPNIILATGAFAVLVWGGFGLGHLWPMVLICTALALPLVLAVLLPAFDTIDPLLWTAAATMGASPLRIIVSVLAPLTAVSVLVAFILAFHTAWDETTFAIFVGPSRPPVIQSRIFAYLQQNVTPEIAAVAALLLILTLLGAALVYGAQRWMRRRAVRALQPDGISQNQRTSLP